MLEGQKEEIATERSLSASVFEIVVRYCTFSNQILNMFGFGLINVQAELFRNHLFINSLLKSSIFNMVLSIHGYVFRIECYCLNKLHKLFGRSAIEYFIAYFKHSCAHLH